MPIKLKSIVEEILNENAAKILLCEFLTLAREQQNKGGGFWEEFRQAITPNKFKTVDEMFKRWSELVKNTADKSSGPILLREFLSLASKEPYKTNDVWEKLRQTITPNKYKTVDGMFNRWSELIKHNKGGA